MIRKDTFVCKSTKGCGGAGNLCRIDRLTTLVNQEQARFTWGGGCSMWDKGTGKVKLPDRAPDPFREREAMVSQLLQALGHQQLGSKRVALTDEFTMKSLFPFFATFIHGLGYELEVYRGADQALLKRGIEESNVPFCAPMQHYHGVVSLLAEREVDYIFMPMLRDIPRVKEEKFSVLCPSSRRAPI